MKVKINLKSIVSIINMFLYLFPPYSLAPLLSPKERIGHLALLVVPTTLALNPRMHKLEAECCFKFWYNAGHHDSQSQWPFISYLLICNKVLHKSAS